jgi:hypothetical protein
MFAQEIYAELCTGKFKITWRWRQRMIVRASVERIFQSVNVYVCSINVRKMNSPSHSFEDAYTDMLYEWYNLLMFCIITRRLNCFRVTQVFAFSGFCYSPHIFKCRPVQNLLSHRLRLGLAAKNDFLRQEIITQKFFLEAWPRGLSAIITGFMYNKKFLFISFQLLSLSFSLVGGTCNA